MTRKQADIRDQLFAINTARFGLEETQPSDDERQTLPFPGERFGGRKANDFNSVVSLLWRLSLASSWDRAIREEPVLAPHDDSLRKAFVACATGCPQLGFVTVDRWQPPDRSPSTQVQNMLALICNSANAITSAHRIGMCRLGREIVGPFRRNVFPERKLGYIEVSSSEECEILLDALLPWCHILFEPRHRVSLTSTGDGASMKYFQRKYEGHPNLSLEPDGAVPAFRLLRKDRNATTLLQVLLMCCAVLAAMST